MSFDEVIHAPNRLKICAFLDATTLAEFSVVRDMLGAADSVVSKHLKVLADAGYVTISKPLGQGRPRAWVELTKEGRRAFRAHVAALRELVDRPLAEQG